MHCRNMENFVEDSLFESRPLYVKLFRRTLGNKKPSEDTIEEHFHFLKSVIERETNLSRLEIWKNFADNSHIHFSDKIKRRGTKRMELLEKEYIETLDVISKRDEKLRTTDKEKGIKLSAGTVGVGYKSKVQKTIPKTTEYV